MNAWIVEKDSVVQINWQSTKEFTQVKSLLNAIFVGIDLQVPVIWFITRKDIKFKSMIEAPVQNQSFHYQLTKMIRTGKSIKNYIIFSYSQFLITDELKQRWNWFDQWRSKSQFQILYSISNTERTIMEIIGIFPNWFDYNIRQIKRSHQNFSRRAWNMKYPKCKMMEKTLQMVKKQDDEIDNFI